MNSSVDKKNNLNEVKNMKLARNKEIIILDSFISFHNYTSKIIKKYNVPIVFSPSYKKQLNKYIEEYKSVINEINKI